MNGPVFFFLFEKKEEGGGIFWFFPLFSMCSHHIRIKFSKSSQSVHKCVPQHDPNSTWVLTHMVCPKFNSHVYKLKTWNLVWKHICFYFAVGGSMKCFSIGACPNVPKKLLMGQSMWLL
jgi:hypothetical protein